MSRPVDALRGARGMLQEPGCVIVADELVEDRLRQGTRRSSHPAQRSRHPGTLQPTRIRRVGLRYWPNVRPRSAISFAGRLRAAKCPETCQAWPPAFLRVLAGRGFGLCLGSPLLVTGSSGVERREGRREVVPGLF